jgi:hypothetical protein
MEGASRGFTERPTMLSEKIRLNRFPTIAQALGGVVGISKKLLTRGTLATRLLVAGILLLVGLPVLTILVYVWGYQPNAVPVPVVVLVDGLQLLIVLNAAVVVSQLAASTGIRVRRIARTRRQTREVATAPALLQRSATAGLHELSLSLAEQIWKMERGGRGALGETVLEYVRDAVTVELEHRRHAAALEQRLADLEIRLAAGSGAGAPDDQR